MNSNLHTVINNYYIFPCVGFHEAVGDAITLSVSNPRHLQRIGLLNNVTDDYGTYAIYIYIYFKTCLIYITQFIK